MHNSSKKVAEIVDDLRRVFQAVHENSKKAKQQAGLTGPQLWTIKVVAESGPINVTDLARRMYLHAATVVGIVDRLETKGLLVRSRSLEDRRVVWIELTRQGKELVKKAPGVVQGLLVSGLESLPLAKLRNVAKGLNQLVEIIGVKDITPRLLLSNELNLPAGQTYAASGEGSLFTKSPRKKLKKRRD